MQQVAHFHDYETMPMPVVTGKLILPPPSLRIDTDGFQYLVSTEKWTGGTLWDDTVCQLESLCERYYALSHKRYPTEIILTEARYLVRPFIPTYRASRRIEHFYVRRMPARPIPFVCDPAAIYEIIVRGEV
jgi:hypothetical protein